MNAAAAAALCRREDERSFQITAARFKRHGGLYSKCTNGKMLHFYIAQTFLRSLDVNPAQYSLITL